MVLTVGYSRSAFSPSKDNGGQEEACTLYVQKFVDRVSSEIKGINREFAAVTASTLPGRLYTRSWNSLTISEVRY